MRIAISLTVARQMDAMTIHQAPPGQNERHMHSSPSNKTRTAAAFVALLVLSCAVSAPGYTQESARLNRLEGFSQPNRVSIVAAATSGIVIEHCVEEGQEVKAGECLIRLDSEAHEQAVQIAKLTKDSLGELRAAEIELRSALERLATLEDLASREHASTTEVKRAQDQVALSRASLMTIQERQLLRAAEYERLLIEAKNYCVRAPFDGVIVEFSKQVGEFVGPAEPGVCKVAELKQLSVDFLIHREDLTQFKKDDTVGVLFLETNQRVQGTVVYISPFPISSTNTYTVKVRVENANGELSAGERCRIESAETIRKSASAPRTNSQLSQVARGEHRDNSNDVE